MTLSLTLFDAQHSDESGEVAFVDVPYNVAGRSRLAFAAKAGQRVTVTG